MKQYLQLIFGAVAIWAAHAIFFLPGLKSASGAIVLQSAFVGAGATLTVIMAVLMGIVALFRKSKHS